MKISVDGVDIFELSEVQLKIMQNNISSEAECPIYGKGFECDLKRRLRYILMHKYEQCFKELKSEWEPKLKEAGIKSIPLDDEEFAALVFAQPNYKSRDDRDADAKRSVVERSL